MTVDALKEHIQGKATGVVAEAESIGVAALKMLEELLEDDDAEIRSLAVSCLSVIHDDKVPGMLIKALADDIDDVYMKALQILRARPIDKSYFPVLIENLNHPDPEVRSEIAIRLGGQDNPAAIDSLSRQLENEDNRDAGINMKLALARLGNDEYKYEFANLLIDDEPGRRLQILEYLEYINDKSLARYLMPALDDQTEGYEIGDPDNPEYVRICDVAINLLSVWYEKRFSFSVDEAKIYYDDEIYEAKKFVELLGE